MPNEYKGIVQDSEDNRTYPHLSPEIEQEIVQEMARRYRYANSGFDPSIYAYNPLTSEGLMSQNRIENHEVGRTPEDVFLHKGDSFLNTDTGQRGYVTGFSSSNKPIVEYNNGVSSEVKKENWLPPVLVKARRHRPADDLDKMFLGMMSIPFAAYGAAELAGLGIGAPAAWDLPIASQVAASNAPTTLNSLGNFVKGTSAFLAGDEAGNMAIRQFTPYNSWGEAVSKTTGMPQGLADWTNPLGWAAPGLFEKGAGALYKGMDRAADIGTSVYNKTKSYYNKAKDTYDWLYGKRLTETFDKLNTLQRAADDIKNRIVTGNPEFNRLNDEVGSLYELIRDNRFPEPTVIHEASSTVPKINTSFGPMSNENWKAFFEKNGAKDAEKLAAMWNPETGRFYQSAPGHKIPYMPEYFVTTGDIPIKDYRTGVTTTYNLNPSNIRPISETTIEYRMNPNQLHYPESTAKVHQVEALNPTLPKEYTQAVQRNMDYVTNEVLPGSKSFGSSSNIAKGNLYHGSHDIDVIMTEANAKKHPEFKKWVEKRGSDTYGYNHPDIGEIDVNIVKESKGKAYGQLAHELYAQLYPKEYRDLMMKAAKEGKELTTDLPLNKTAQELLDVYDPVTKGILDAFASNKGKHMGRAYYYLHYGKVSDVRKGFDAYANYLLGGEYRPSSIKLSEFSDAQANSMLIDELGLNVNKEQFIHNPERMKLLFDYAVLDKSFVGRGVPSDNPIKSLTYWYPENNGGTANGVGLNTVIGAYSGYGNVYGTIIPDRFKPYNAITPTGVLEQISNNIVTRDLTNSEQILIQQLAEKHNVNITSTNTLQNVLRATENKNGQKYKDFIADIAKEFDIPLIKGSDYTGRGGYYASLLEDQSEDAIKQLFLNGMDKPIPDTQRYSSISYSQPYYATPQDLSEIRTIIEKRNRKYLNTPKEHYNLRLLANKRKEKVMEQRDVLWDTIKKKANNPDYTHHTALKNIDKKARELRNRLQEIRSTIRKTRNVGLTGIAGFGSHELASQLFSTNEQENRNLARRFMSRESNLKYTKGLTEFEKIQLEDIIAENPDVIREIRRGTVDVKKDLLNGTAAYLYSNSNTSDNNIQ